MIIRCDVGAQNIPERSVEALVQHKGRCQDSKECCLGVTDTAVCRPFCLCHVADELRLHQKVRVSEHFRNNSHESPKWHEPDGDLGLFENSCEICQRDAEANKRTVQTLEQDPFYESRRPAEVDQDGWHKDYSQTTWLYTRDIKGLHFPTAFIWATFECDQEPFIGTGPGCCRAVGLLQQPPSPPRVYT